MEAELEKKFFKLLGSEFIPSTIAGRFKFGRLNYYRLLEAVEQDENIGDINEGTKNFLLEKLSIQGEERSPAQVALEQAGVIKIAPGASCDIKDLSVRQEVDCFIFCMTCTEEKELPDCLIGEYDGCLEIVDIERFGHAIYAGTVNGKPVSELFDISAASVTYSTLPTEREILALVTNPAHPFEKHIKYANQKEFRVVLFPKVPIEADNVFVTIEPPTDLLQQHSLPPPSDPKPKVVPSKEEERLVQVEAVKEFHSALDGWGGRERPVPPPMYASHEELVAWSQDHREKEAAEFEPFRRRMMKAYWVLRSLGDKTFLDQAILGGMPPRMFTSRACLFLGGIGHPKPPPF